MRGYSSGHAGAVTFILPDGPVSEWGNPGERAVEGQGNTRYGWFPDIVEEKETYKDSTINVEQVKLRKHASILCSTLWGFKFYCQAGKATKGDIEEKLASLIPPITAEDVAAGRLAGIIRTRLDDLKEVYYELFGASSGQNSTSLVCCHGPALPLGNGTGEMRSWADILIEPLLFPPEHTKILDNGTCQGVVIFFHCCLGGPSQASRHWLPPSHQMLFGDSNLEVKKYETHFSDELPKICLASLPHHGSRHNWRKRFHRIMPNCYLWVASFGLGNRYMHPHKKVLNAVREADREILLCTEAQGLGIRIHRGVLPN